MIREAGPYESGGPHRRRILTTSRPPTKMTESGDVSNSMLIEHAMDSMLDQGQAIYFVAGNRAFYLTDVEVAELVETLLTVRAEALDRLAEIKEKPNGR